METKYTVYVRTDARGNILEINSDYYLMDLDGYTPIDEGGMERHRDAAEKYLPKGIDGFNGRVYTPNYKLVNGVVTERTDEEKALDPYSDIPEPITEETSRDVEQILSILEGSAE